MPQKSQRSSNEPPEYLLLGLTPNQVVAFNLALARQHKGLTQDEAAAALEPYLGKRWSKASVSQAERSIAGRFVRNFDADELVAFARAFEGAARLVLHAAAPWSNQPGVPVRLSTPDAERFGTALSLLVDLVFGDDVQQAELAMRLDAFLDQLGLNPLTKSQQRIVAAVNLRIAAGHRQPARGPGAPGQGRTGEEEGLAVADLVDRHLKLGDVNEGVTLDDLEGGPV